jgi:uncharacterized protein YcnI
MDFHSKWVVTVLRNKNLKIYVFSASETKKGAIEKFMVAAKFPDWKHYRDAGFVAEKIWPLIRCSKTQSTH